jgi:ketosteroid isomerase-like protein
MNIHGMRLGVPALVLWWAAGLAAAGLEQEKAAVRQAAYIFVGWALEGKNLEALQAAVSHGEDLFLFQPDSRATVAGYEEFKKLFPLWMSPDFKATKTELRDVRIGISAAGDSAWFSAILDDCGEVKGQPVCWSDCRYSGVLEKRQGLWVFVQAHFSLARDKVIEEFRQRLKEQAPGRQ